MVNPQGNETKNRNTKNRRQNTQREKWNERVIQISRVTKVCKGGKKLSFRAVVLIGNENGRVGLGVGKADDVVNAIDKTPLLHCREDDAAATGAEEEQEGTAEVDVPDELQEWISLNEEAEIHPNFVGQIDAFKDPNCVDPTADQ